MGSLPRTVRKRDGRLVPFELERIANAIGKAMSAAGEGRVPEDAQRVAGEVAQQLASRAVELPEVEQLQDLVERTLILEGFAKTAKAYILYRHERAILREQAKQVPEEVRRKVEESRRYFPNALSELTYYRTYSRWLDSEARRETWVETVDRYMAFMRENVSDAISEEAYAQVREAILSMRVMPSMRLLWSAGPAARSTHVAAYNCAYCAPTCVRDLSEIMYLLMCGVGVGFSVESRFAQCFPVVAAQTGAKAQTHLVGDSREGWCEALSLGLDAWFAGRDLQFDYSQVRPAGARLRTLGGRASGPKPLAALLEHCRSTLLAAQGRRLRNLELHDLICKMGEGVVMGGVRRSALISLSDLDDEELRGAKKGQFWVSHPERAMANNSAVYETRPPATKFLEEWLALAQSGTGERGLFNRGALSKQLPARRWESFGEAKNSAGTNPCGEIVLRSKQFCNLSEVVARPEDTEQSLLEKVRLATLLGTWQSTLTRFPYLGDEWRHNCEEERLLGVSITGQWDCPAVRDPGTLERLRQAAIDANEHYARRLGIRPSLAITCVKPSGTVSLLVDSASGMHPRHAAYYLRRVRISAVDPILAMLRDQKLPCVPEPSLTEGIEGSYVLELPVRAPEQAVLRDQLSALEQLEHWRMVKRYYTEHNPSVTISIGADEWIRVADWLFERWDELGGLAFLPRSQSVYPLAPLEEISRQEYERRVAALPRIDFSRLVLYEKEDHTAGARAFACIGGGCELDPEEGSYPTGPGR